MGGRGAGFGFFFFFRYVSFVFSSKGAFCTSLQQHRIGQILLTESVTINGLSTQ